MNALVRDLTLDEIAAVSGGITEIVVTAERTSSGGSSPAASGDSRDSEVASRQQQLQSQNRKAPVAEERDNSQGSILSGELGTGKVTASCCPVNINADFGKITIDIPEALNAIGRSAVKQYEQRQAWINSRK